MTRSISPLLGLLAASAMTAQAAMAETPSPLERQPVRLFQFETANVMPKGALELYVGTMETNIGANVGTGNQVYFGGGSYALTDRLSFGADLSSYQDPTIKPINGSNPDIVINIASAWAKYQLYRGDRLSASVLGSLEYYVKIDSPLFGPKVHGDVAASVKLPVSYSVTPDLQFHLTPSVSVHPQTVAGGTYYGTIVSIGAGASYRASDRLGFYGAVDVPVSGGNTISNTAAFVRQPVWTLGARFNATPKVALDAYVTNGVGTTPATSVFTFWPDGDTVLAGVRLTYTPGARYNESYRGTPAQLSPRQRDLQADGPTLMSADVLDPGIAAASGWYGTDGNYGVALAFSPTRDGQIDVIIEDYADNGSLPASLVPTTRPRYMFGPKLRLLDQANGDAFSLSGRLLFGRQLESGAGGKGVFYLEGAAGYQVNDRIALTLSPKVALWGKTDLVGLGAGVNVRLTENLQLIGEATAVGIDATRPVWSAGIRYEVPGTALYVDAQATNAIGHDGIGTMLAQDEPRFALGVTKRFGIPFWR